MVKRARKDTKVACATTFRTNLDGRHMPPLRRSQLDGCLVHRTTFFIQIIVRVGKSYLFDFDIMLSKIDRINVEELRRENAEPPSIQPANCSDYVSRFRAVGLGRVAEFSLVGFAEMTGRFEAASGRYLQNRQI